MAQLSPRLTKSLTEQPNEFYPVKVEFVSQVSFEDLRNTLRDRNISVSEWPRFVNRALIKQANKSQASAKQLLLSKSLPISIIAFAMRWW